MRMMTRNEFSRPMPRRGGRRLLLVEEGNQIYHILLTVRFLLSVRWMHAWGRMIKDRTRMYTK